MEARSITREFLHFIWIGRSCKAASHFEKIKSEFRMQKQETLQIVINGPYPGGGGGNSHMEQTGMLVGNFEFNP